MKKRIYIAIPNYTGNLHWHVVKSLMYMLMHEYKRKEQELICEIVPRMRAPRVRNYIGHQMLKCDATHLLTIDDDHIFQHDALERLMAHDKDIVGALAFLRSEDNSTSLAPSMYQRGRIQPPGYKTHDQWQFGDLVEVDAMGMAMVLIKRHVLETVAPPWWWLGPTPEEPLGEDFYFCWRAQQAGFKLYVDTALEVPHLSEPILLHSDMWRQERENGTLRSA